MYASPALGCRNAGWAATRLAVFSAARVAGVGECGAVMGVAPVAVPAMAATSTPAVRAAPTTYAPLDTFTLSSPCRVVTVFIDAHVYQSGGRPVNILRPFWVRRFRQGGALALFAAVLGGLAACASSHVTPGPAGSAAAGSALPAITVQRTGGLA